MPRYEITNESLYTKCGWTPFAGMQVWGRVQRVVLRGAVAYDADDPASLAEPGRGRLVP